MVGPSRLQALGCAGLKLLPLNVTLSQARIKLLK
jgi:hypothetical protein